MMNSKSNNIPVDTLFLRHPRYDISARVSSLSEQLFDFMMQYNGHRESAHVMVNLCKTLPNTCLELACEEP